jgi:hypothetical protein
MQNSLASIIWGYKEIFLEKISSLVLIVDLGILVSRPKYNLRLKYNPFLFLHKK